MLCNKPGEQWQQLPNFKKEKKKKIGLEIRGSKYREKVNEKTTR